MSNIRLLGAFTVAVASVSAQATILTFDIAGLSNGQTMNQGYGDAVTATSMGSFTYGAGAEGFTPNVQVTYGSGDPSYWASGYGDLTKILMEDQDSTGVLTITLAADSGFAGVLYGFDMAAFSSAFSGDPTVQLIDVTDGGSTTYYSLSNGSISETTHTSFDFSAMPIVGETLLIRVDARNLGSLNDDIGIDNIRFGQQPVPEPASVIAVGLGAAGLLRRRRPGSSRP